MRQVTVEEVLARLERHRAAGLHVDSRLLREVRQPGEMYVVSLPDPSAFLALIWQSVNDARPLVPVHQPRTLRDCASRMTAFEWRFEKLVESGHPWFEKCVAIDRAFELSKFGWTTAYTRASSSRRGSCAGRSNTHHWRRSS